MTFRQFLEQGSKPFGFHVKPWKAPRLRGHPDCTAAKAIEDPYKGPKTKKFKPPIYFTRVGKIG